MKGISNWTQVETVKYKDWQMRDTNCKNKAGILAWCHSGGSSYFKAMPPAKNFAIGYGLLYKYL